METAQRGAEVLNAGRVSHACKRVDKEAPACQLASLRLQHASTQSAWKHIIAGRTSVPFHLIFTSLSVKDQTDAVLLRKASSLAMTSSLVAELKSKPVTRGGSVARRVAGAGSILRRGSKPSSCGEWL